MSETQMPPPTKRRWRWVLGISLALNLVFIGLFAGAALRHVASDGGKRERAGLAQNFGGPLARSLPPEARRQLNRQLLSTVSGLPSRSERRALYAEVLDALRADPFEPERVSALFEVQSRVAQDVQSFGQRAWLEIVAGMSVAERRVVADRVEEALRRPRFRRPRDKDR